ncbi:MAG: precorrin-3B synthase [Pseudomonadota bacterium]
MSAPFIQGWCPGALRPMASGDGLVVRIRPRAGRLTADQARGIAALSRQHGNGLIDLSNRANVQLRGVTEASHPALINGLRALDLIDTDATDEARRNIVVSPFWTEADGSQDIAIALAKALTAPEAPILPGKFGYSIDPAKFSTLRTTSVDIRIEWHLSGWLVRGESFATGAMVNSAEAAASAAVELARWFVAHGGVEGGRGRMAQLWQSESLKARHDRLPQRFQEGGAMAASAPQPAPGTCAQGQLVGFDFGQMQAETLAALADLGALRVTPWRMLLIEGATKAPDMPGLITRADDPMLRVIACTGAPGCLQAHAATRPLARALASRVSETLHVSGCAKGCAHPGPAALTLTATPDGFALIRNGKASGTPLRDKLSATDLTETNILNEFP